MKKILSHLVSGLVGISIGMFIMFQITKGSISNTTIKGKVIQKRNENSTQDVRSIIKKEDRKNKKELKKESRRKKRAEKENE